MNELQQHSKKTHHRMKGVENSFIDLIDSINRLIFQQQQQKRTSNSQTSKLSIIQLNNNVERFRESDIRYFDPTCSESHDKSDYVIIDDKVYYRNV